MSRKLAGMQTNTVAATAADDQAKFMLDFEVNVITEMYTKLSSVCYQKCITRKHATSDFLKGESACIDRCVAKYLEFYQKVSEKLAEINSKALVDEKSVATSR